MRSAHPPSPPPPPPAGAPSPSDADPGDAEFLALLKAATATRPLSADADALILAALDTAADRRSVWRPVRRPWAELALAASLGIAAGLGLHLTAERPAADADAPVAIAGDVDADGQLAMNDVLLLSRWRTRPADSRHDLNDDGQITDADVADLERRVLAAPPAVQS